MKITRILLALVFLAVGAVYTIQGLRSDTAADDPPVLTCGDDTVYVSVNDDSSAILAGVTATDAQDGDLTDQVLVSGLSKLTGTNTAQVSYVVFDSDDNMATLTRNVCYTDYQRPRFILDEPLTYFADDQLSLLERLRATDVLDGDITEDIRISYIKPTTDPEIFTMDARVTNSMGDTAWLTVPVILMATDRKPLDVRLDTYLLYLEQGGSFEAKAHLLRAEADGLSVSLDNVSISGEVDPDTPGTYMVHYNCVYGSRYGTAVLTVVVE